VGRGGALQSGAFEALVHDELERVGAADAYARVVGRSTAAGTAAVALSTALAAPVFAAGGFTAVGIASVVAGVACAAVAATLPEHRPERPPDGGGVVRGQLDAVREGVGEVRSRRAVRRALLLLAPIAAIWGALDEYVPLLAREDAGASAAAVPLLVLIVYVGMSAGGLLAGTAERWSRGRLGLLLAASAVALAAGALSGVPAGFVLVGAAFCGLQALTVVADARLQAAIEGSSRATVTSLAGLVTEVLTVGVFATYGAGSAVAGNGVLFAAFAGVYLVVAAVLAGRGPRRVAARR
jgi:hypothetical protein